MLHLFAHEPDQIMKLDCNFIVHKISCSRYNNAEEIFKLRKCRLSRWYITTTLGWSYLQLRLFCKAKVNSDRKIIEKIKVKNWRWDFFTEKNRTFSQWDKTHDIFLSKGHSILISFKLMKLLTSVRLIDNDHTKMHLKSRGN